MRIWSLTNVSAPSPSPSPTSIPQFESNSTLAWIHVTGLEPDTGYRCVVESFNVLGPSQSGAQLLFRTVLPLSSEKPVYASADEQRHNGLIGAKIIGDDFLELTLGLCALVVICVVSIISVIAYCHRGRSEGDKKGTNNQSSAGNNRDPSEEDSLQNEDKVCDLSEDKFANYLNDQSSMVQPFNHQHHHHPHQQHHLQTSGISSASNSTQEDKIRCGSTNSSYLTRSDDFPSPPTFAAVALPAQQCKSPPAVLIQCSY